MYKVRYRTSIRMAHNEPSITSWFAIPLTLTIDLPQIEL